MRSLVEDVFWLSFLIISGKLLRDEDGRSIEEKKLYYHHVVIAA